MLQQKQWEVLVGKAEQLAEVYSKYRFQILEEAQCQVFVTREHFTKPPENAGYRNIGKGDVWGDDCDYAWFRASFYFKKEYEGRRIALYADTDATEHLVFWQGEPVGALDYFAGCAAEARLHVYWELPAGLKAGGTYSADLEGYASHLFPSCFTMGQPVTFSHSVRKGPRVFRGIYLIEVNKEIEEFLNGLRFLKSLYDSEKDAYRRAKWENAYLRLFKLAYRFPEECDDRQEVEDSVRACNAYLKELFEEGETEEGPFVSLIGHSHLDTAWLWDTEETMRKNARTVAIALRGLERFPEYTFIQSSALHQKWLKEQYPDLFARLKHFEAEGRFECNGGSYIEFDANLAGGEAIVRQFLFGQKFLRENFGHTADMHWLPDSFGYSPALPQILKKCGIRYFMTTKLDNNDTNRFPYETFYWKGIDGTQILTQFNILGCYADPATVRARLERVEDKHSAAGTLISYGFGDGGGGPDETMISVALMTQKSRFTPQVRHTTASAHMRRVEAESKGLPVYDGELYLETHRGTYTSKARIKRCNRKLELRLRELEMLAALLGENCKGRLDEITETLLLNQFHDILPGSAIACVHENALKRYEKAFADADALAASLGAKKDRAFNSFAWQVNVNIEQDGDGEGAYTALDGSRKKLLYGVCIPPLSSVPLPQTREDGTPFAFDGTRLETPYYTAVFDGARRIVSLYDKAAEREIVRGGGCLNKLLCGEDAPYSLDNWDIEADQHFKMREETRLISSEVLSSKGHFRLRNAYRVGERSLLTQDVVFYPNTKRIDFETRAEWKERHRLLKTAFDIDVKSGFLRTEVQFGHVLRSMKVNTPEESARFEFCNHKWADLSDNRYGVALLNDCKYGLGLQGDEISLTLLKCGTHPDGTGDDGVHMFKYALLPHEGGFSAETVVRPAYEFNQPPCAAPEKEIPALLAFDQPNVVLEAIKAAEDGKGKIVRLYECEGCKANLNVRFGKKCRVTVCDLLENSTGKAAEADSFAYCMQPFEILTLRIE